MRDVVVVGALLLVALVACENPKSGSNSEPPRTDGSGQTANVKPIPPPPASNAPSQGAVDKPIQPLGSEIEHKGIKY